MRIKEIKLYKFDELSDDAKEKARNWYGEGYDGQFAWEYILEDAKEIGLKIHSLDQHRANKGEFITSAPECIEDIFVKHGKECETYKTAERYAPSFKDLESKRDNDDETFEDQFANIEHEFLHDLLEDYRIMFEKEIEYQNSDEVVDETLIANEYEFTEDGEIA